MANRYRAHVQNHGWDKDWTPFGKAIGTEGKSQRLEAIAIETVPGLRLGMRLYSQDQAWKDFGECKGQEMGSEGKSRRIEAIVPYIIENTTGKDYDFYTHQAGIGWDDGRKITAKGQMSGSTDQSRAIEAIRIVER